MKRLWIMLGLAVLTVAAVWLWAPRAAVQGSSAGAKTTVAAVEQAGRAAGRSSTAADLARVTTKRQVGAKQREAYLRRISDGLTRRGRSGDEPNPSDHAQDSSAREGDARDPSNDGGHPIQDKSNGELSDLVEAVSQDLMPLAEECYEAAVERDPSIAGMIDINLEVVGDEDVGGIVESFELGEENEIQDEQMIECIRETTLSTLFPAPDDSGRREARLTLRFEPE